MMQLIDGKSLARERRLRIANDVDRLGVIPGLAVLLIGDDRASHIYVDRKERAAKLAGIHFEKHLFPADTDESILLSTIRSLNERDTIHGIVVQLPAPAPLNEDTLIRALDPRKDVDGFHPQNIAAMLRGEDVILPGLVQAILSLLDAAHAPLERARVAVIAKSPVFTDPLSHVLENRGARITVARTDVDAYDALGEATIVITALGHPQWIRGDMLADGVIIIDVGINALPDGRVVGDVDQASVSAKAAWLTPVPGGVGPMTVAMLLANTVEACRRIRSGVPPMPTA